MVKLALLQARSGIDPERNAATVLEALDTAAAGGAEILFTPEMSGLLDRNRERAASNIRDERSDPLLAAVCAAARERRIWVQLGSLALALEEGSPGGERLEGARLANRSFLIDSSGEVRARYDKMHLFDVDLPGGESWRESALYRAGGQPVVAQGTPLGMLGLTICYDLRFAELFTRLAEAGAQAIAVPAAFTVPTGRAHWHVLLRARAIETGCFVIAAAQGGLHEDGRRTFGHSLVVDPWGTVLLDMGEDAGVGFAEVDIGLVAEVRGRIPSVAHRRPIGPAVIAA